jgi:hypothetical protein
MSCGDGGSPESLEGVMKNRTAGAYLDGFATVKSVIELDALTVLEVVEALDPEREDPLLTPWKRGYNAAIRSALGH